MILIRVTTLSEVNQPTLIIISLEDHKMQSACSVYCSTVYSNQIVNKQKKGVSEGIANSEETMEEKYNKINIDIETLKNDSQEKFDGVNTLRIRKQKKIEKQITPKEKDHFDHGIYVCSKCDHPLFSSETKYTHDSPWPAFTSTLREDSVAKREEKPGALKVTCGSCGNGLGHEFIGDGPKGKSRF